MINTLKGDLRRHGHSWLATALVVVFGMQLLRILFLSFVGYLRDSLDIGSLDLAPIAVGVFALSLLAGALNRLAGSRNGLWITGGGVALLRLVEQFVTTASLDLYLSVAGVALFLMYIPIALGLARARGGSAGLHFAAALILGLALDSAILVGAKTLDLSWQSGLIPVGIVLILAGALIWTLERQAAEAVAATDGSWLANLGLLAFGPWLMLQLLVFQNPAAVSSFTGWQTPAAGALILVGDALGVWLGLGAAGRRRGFGYAFFMGLFLLLVLLPGNESSGGAFIIWLLLGNIFSLVLGVLILQRAASVEGKPGLLATALTHGFGQILFVLMTFVYYASYDINLGLRSGAVLPVAAGLIAILAALSRLGKPAETHTFKGNSPARLAAGLLVVPLALALTWKTPQSVSPPAGLDSVRVMDYNLHGSTNTDGRLDPEALARVIEESGADIIGLQEVSRGWLIWGGFDMLNWFSQRLDMPYVWNPTADAQWGNALFSRYPIVQAETRGLPPEDLLLRRGIILAEIELGGTSLNVISTHFTHMDEQEQERLIQASAVLDAWSQEAATIFMGDLNARPDSDAIRILVENGFVDISAEIGQPPTYTYYSANPDHQIDYIFASPDLGFRDFEILRSTASDHLPLVVSIELP